MNEELAQRNELLRRDAALDSDRNKLLMSSVNEIHRMFTMLWTETGFLNHQTSQFEGFLLYS